MPHAHGIVERGSLPALHKLTGTGRSCAIYVQYLTTDKGPDQRMSVLILHRTNNAAKLREWVAAAQAAGLFIGPVNWYD